MSAREVIGLTLIIVALVLVPAAWITSRLLWLASFLALVAGVILFFSARVQRRMEKSEEGASSCGSSGGRAMPTDIHNYTGWRSGGRSETMDSSGEAEGD